MPHREGFACAGAWFREHVKIVAQLPEPGQEALIVNEERRTGGHAFEMLSHLRRMDNDLPLYALGLLGEDEDGHAILSACQKQEIDTFQLQVTEAAPTASAIVIRTQTHDAETRLLVYGANADLSAEHFDFRHCLAQWFHLSDVHRLSRLQQSEETPGSAAGKILQTARAEGMTTSLTWAAEGNAQVLSSLLPWLDYLVIDAQAFAALMQCKHGIDTVTEENVHRAAAEILRTGLARGLAIRFNGKAFGLLHAGESAWHDCAGLPVPSQAAFSAGFLYGRYCEWELQRCLAAACGE